MIDIQKAEEEFKKYVSKYNMDESHIERKVRHTFRVEKISGEISKSLNMSEDEINLAKLIGLLHDIARFEQYTQYKTFDDNKSKDHGDWAVEILSENNYLRKYIQTLEYDTIILKAIKNHNKYTMETNINPKEERFCKIIRDADKLDIIYEATCEFWEGNIENMNLQEISDKALEQFLEEKSVDKKYTPKDIDRIIVICAFIYDFYFRSSYRIIKENDYINKMLNRFDFKKEETKKQIESVRNIAQEYINKKIEEGNICLKNY